MKNKIILVTSSTGRTAIVFAGKGIEKP